MSRTVFGVVTALLLMSATVAAGQDSIAAARDLYASAAYEDALEVLNRLPDSNRPADEALTIEQYRAFCLLALGRTAEAQHAIEAVVAGQPMYHPSSDVSPRVRAAFTEVRKRVLPTLIQQQYAQAKTLYDRKDFPGAASAFKQVLVMMDDPDAASVVAQPPLSDLRTLAAGFQDLAATAATPPPPLPVAPPPAPAAAAAVVPTVPKATRVFTSADAAVVPPVTIRQDLPSFPGQVIIPRQGLIEVVVDETGLVESAIMRQSITSSYDALAIAAARNWRYRPAMAEGLPVKYRKAVQISIKPTGR